MVWQSERMSRRECTACFRPEIGLLPGGARVGRAGVLVRLAHVRTLGGPVDLAGAALTGRRRDIAAAGNGGLGALRTARGRSTGPLRPLPLVLLLGVRLLVGPRAAGPGVHAGIRAG